MSHSKRNTSLAFFTSHERSLLKSTWGSQATRLSRDSFLPFASCQLCLQIAREPVACASNGDIFCRECAVSNLLAQRNEIKRLEKDESRRRKEEEEEDRARGEEEKEKSIEEFERVMMGMEGTAKKVTNTITSTDNGEIKGESKRGVKRKFELDEDEMLKNAKAERAKARVALDEEKSSRPTLPSFWVPSLTPTTTKNSSKPTKLFPFCPASSSTEVHPLSLKTLISINFTTAESAGHSAKAPTFLCPACKKALTNTLKAMFTIPCGHVLCKPCAKKFMSIEKASDPHASNQEDRQACYVCDTSLSHQEPSKHDSKTKKGDDRARLKPGLVEINSEGTGFAGGGKNMAKREGIAFQC